MWKETSIFARSFGSISPASDRRSFPKILSRTAAQALSSSVKMTPMLWPLRYQPRTSVSRMPASRTLPMLLMTTRFGCGFTSFEMSMSISMKGFFERWVLLRSRESMRLK